MQNKIRINGSRLWQRLMAIGEIGRIAGTTGCDRQALTDGDKASRDLFITWAEEIDCEIAIDNIGNLSATLVGSEPELPPVITGSHLDTQPTGGMFDGIYGCLAGLEVLTTIAQNNIKHNHSLKVTVWTNEEGCRFKTAMMGSAVWSGMMTPEEAYALCDDNGTSVLDELKRLEYLGAPVKATAKAAFELHIEQGPVLEQQDKTIGVVTSVQHMSRHKVTISGVEAHAGPTPMSMRKDPIKALAKILPALYEFGNDSGVDGRVTIGQIETYPGSNNTVPGELMFTIDLRHPIEENYKQLVSQSYKAIKSICEELNLPVEVGCFWHSHGIEFDKNCVNSVEKAVAHLGYSNMEIFSGAGHDACNVASVVPTSMIFIPCKDGISHNVNEMATESDVTAGANVLLHAMLDQANTFASNE
jgi:N-carbamoyl-L-amino-acid hydrolase